MLSTAAAIAEPLECRRLLAASLVKDINAAPLRTTYPQRFAPVGTIAYFAANTVANGEELWKTDGTAAGTTLIKDIYAGTLSSQPANFTTIGTTTYFSAGDAANGTELWKTDGTPGGTTLVKDINPGAASSRPVGLTALGTTLYFFADNGTNGVELWKSDGTAGGTSMVIDLRPGTSGQTSAGSPRFATALNGALLFGGTNGGTSGLYKTDGTVAGTVLVASSGFGGSGNRLDSPVQSLTTLSGKAYLRDQTGGAYVSDGTNAGTIRIHSGSNGSVTSAFADVNGTIYYAGQYDLWKYASGVETSVSSASAPSNFAVMNGALYFTANHASAGYELLRTDPSLNTVSVVKDIALNSASSYPSNLAVVGGSTLYFTTGETSTGYSLYKSDGTGAGTVLVRALWTAGPSSNSFQAPINGFAMGSAYYFVVDDGATAGPELWRSAGTSATTAMVKEIYTGTGHSLPAPLVNAGSYSVFIADDGVHGLELWRTDGTAAGTFMLADIFAGGSGSSIRYLTAINNVVYFCAYTTAAGDELYRTNSTGTSVSLVADINPGTESSEPAGFALQSDANSSYIYFAATDVAHGRELWRMQVSPSTGVPQLAMDIVPGTDSSFPEEITRVSTSATTQILFSATTPASGTELWRVLSFNVSMLADIRPGSASSSPTGFAPMAWSFGSIPGYMFSADDGVHGREPWKTEFVMDTVQLAADIVVGAGSSNPAQMTAVNAGTYLVANDGSHGNELWRIPYNEKAYLVADIVAGSGSPSLTALSAVNNQLIFAATTSAAGTEVWRSAGTLGSTKMLKDINPGAAGIFVVGSPKFVVVNGRAFFAADDGAHGGEIWTTDGTTNGTFMTVDLSPGLMYGAYFMAGSMGNDVYFDGADTSGAGVELFKLTDTFGPAQVGMTVGRQIEKVGIQFSDILASSLTPAEVSLVNTETAAVFPTNRLRIDVLDRNVIEVAVTNVQGNQRLTNGAWRLTIAAGAITDSLGNPNPLPIVFNFICEYLTNDHEEIVLKLDPTATNASLTTTSFTFGTTVYTAPMATLDGVYVFGWGGNDNVTIDMSNGNPLPGDGRSNVFDGNTGNDTISYVGLVNAADTATYRAAAVEIGAGAARIDRFDVEDYRFDGKGGSTGDAVTVLGATKVSLAGSQVLASLSIDDAATTSVAQNGNSLINVATFTLAPTATLDLNDNDLRLTGTSAAIARAALLNGRIISTTANNSPTGNTTLGLLTGAEFLNNNGGPFDGQTVSASDVLIKYTYFGDVDFNGTIDASDYNLIDFGFSNHLTGWSWGDADGNGSVDVSDYNLIDYAFSTQTGVL